MKTNKKLTKKEQKIVDEFMFIFKKYNYIKPIRIAELLITYFPYE